MIDDWNPMFTRTDETEQAVRDSDLAAEMAAEGWSPRIRQSAKEALADRMERLYSLTSDLRKPYEVEAEGNEELWPGQCPRCRDLHDADGTPDENGNRFIEELGICNNCEEEQ